MNEATIQFILTHSDDNPHQLMLHATRYPDVDIAYAVHQIAARQRIRYKLPGFYSNPGIEYPQQLSLEQCSSEQTARHKAELVSGTLLVDLTGGFGVDFYYMAQRMKQGIYVERRPELCNLATKNFKQLGLTNYEVINAAADEIIPDLPHMDWVFIDPHRRDSTGRKMVLISDCEPDLNTLVPLLLEKSNNLLVKLSPMLDLHLALTELPGTVQVDILAVENECKELVFVIQKNTLNKNIAIRCFNYTKNREVQQVEFSGIKDTTDVEYCTEPLDYLYEPNVALLKSGAYNRIAQRYKLMKFHPNTHLYTSSECIYDFPGRVFAVVEVKESSRQTYSYLSERYSSANISVRNFPMSSDELRKKTRLKDGGDLYIFAFKTFDNQNFITVCKKI